MTLASLASVFETPTARIDAPGGTLAYYRRGSGPDVVAVHGWPLHSATFRTLLPYLERDFTVHMFDFPGTGRTAWASHASFETNRQALERGIDAIGLGRYALLAHDTGGLIARQIAAHDRRVAGLVLSGSEIPGHHPPMFGAILGAVKFGLGPALFSMFRFGPIRRSNLGFGTCFTDSAYVDGEFKELFLRPMADPAAASGQLQLLHAFDSAEVDALAQVHAQIEAPTLCIWGDGDPFFPVHKARAMLAQFKGGATLEAIPGAKLYAHEDHPQEFASYARPFLARCLGAGVRPMEEGRLQPGQA